MRKCCQYEGYLTWLLGQGEVQGTHGCDGELVPRLSLEYPAITIKLQIFFFNLSEKAGKYNVSALFTSVRQG